MTLQRSPGGMGGQWGSPRTCLLRAFPLISEQMKLRPLSPGQWNCRGTPGNVGYSFIPSCSRGSAPGEGTRESRYPCVSSDVWPRQGQQRGSRGCRWESQEGHWLPLGTSFPTSDCFPYHFSHRLVTRVLKTGQQASRSQWTAPGFNHPVFSGISHSGPFPSSLRQCQGIQTLRFV